MTATIINLRKGLTAAQIRRARERLEMEVCSPTRRDDHTLVQDLARLTTQINYAAVLVGAARPLCSWQKEASGMKGYAGGTTLDRVFQSLYDGAESVMFKALDEYPVTQGLGKPRRRQRAGRKIPCGDKS
jgi:hypothetical protein